MDGAREPSETSSPAPDAAAAADTQPAGVSSAVLWALVIKAALALLLVLAAAHHPDDSPYLAPRGADTPETAWVLSRGFDANAYQRLALEGYYDDFSRNYPPGYPLLIRALHPLVGDAATAAVLVSNVMALAALLLFAALARRLAARRGGSPAAAVLLFACLPGWLVFGTVAYSESSWMVLSLLGWLVWSGASWSSGDASAAGVRAAAGQGDGASPGPRAPGRLALASLLTGAAVLVRHAGAFQLVAFGLLELARVRRASDRRRALLEAGASLWVVLPVAAYFAWKYSAHGLAELQSEIWDMRLVPLGGPWSLIAAGATPEYVAQILASLPLALMLLVTLWRSDRGLALLAGCGLVLFLSYTGTAAQSFTRYTWTLWPLALGALRLDRVVVGGLAGWLFCVSAMVGIGWVLGTVAL